MSDDTVSVKPAAEGTFSVDAIAAQARAKQSLLSRTVPDSLPLQDVCAGVAAAAERAQIRVRRMKSPLGLGRVRLYLVALAVGWLAVWVYVNYLATREIRIAVPASDSVLLQERALGSGSKYLKFVECQGSTEGKQLAASGIVDFTVIQGGVSVPTDFDVVGVVRYEHVIYFEKKKLPPPGTPPTVITFNPEQGSHLLGAKFFEEWGYPEVRWVHAWADLSTKDGAAVPDAHAAFMVVDPSDPSTRRGIRALAGAGFVLRDPYLGAAQERYRFIRRKAVAPGYFHVRNPVVPAEGGFHTYSVEDYLVAAPSVTDWQRMETLRALRMQPSAEDLPTQVFHTPGTSVVGDLADVVEVTVNLVIIIAALFGLEIIFHRRYLSELNTLISRVSLLQAERDLSDARDAEAADRSLRYLDVCADLLGLISSVAGYYGKEDASLLFSGLTSTIHTRANELMINIHLKLLHGRKQV